jgi:hypothetical protein
LSSIFFECFSIVRYNTFSFVSINLHSQAIKRQKSFRKNKKNVETLSESFTSRGKGTPSISGDRKRTKPKRQKKHLNTKMWPKPETILRAQKTETNRTARTSPLLHRHSLGAKRRTKAAAIFNKTNNDSDRHIPALLPR